MPGFFSYKKQCRADIRSSLFLSLYSCITLLVIGWHNCKCRECIRLNLKGERTLWDDHCLTPNCNTKLYIYLLWTLSFPPLFLPPFFFWSCCMHWAHGSQQGLNLSPLWKRGILTTGVSKSFLPPVLVRMCLGHSSGSTGVIGNYWLNPPADSHCLHWILLLLHLHFSYQDIVSSFER